METKKQRTLRKWEIILLFAPVLVLVLVGLVSRLETIELPPNRLIESGKPLLTVVPCVKANDSGALCHAVRMPDGTYKVYWVQQF
jgi:hypothetical protein